MRMLIGRISITPNGTCVYAVQVHRLINGYNLGAWHKHNVRHL